MQHENGFSQTKKNNNTKNQGKNKKPTMEELKILRMCVVIKHPGRDLTNTPGKKQYCFRCGYENHYAPNCEAVLKKDQEETSNAQTEGSSISSQPPNMQDALGFFQAYQKYMTDQQSTSSGSTKVWGSNHLL